MAEYYVIANKDKTEYFTTTTINYIHYTMKPVDIKNAIMFESLDYARKTLQDYEGNKICGNLNQYQFIKININIVEENIEPYTKTLKFEYTTRKNEEDITKEDIKSMLMSNFGIDKDFDYKLTMTNKRNRIHIAKVKVTLKD